MIRRWLCSKHCLFVRMKLAGPPDDKEIDVEEWREVAALSTTFLWDSWSDPRIVPCCYAIRIDIWDRALSSNHWGGGHAWPGLLPGVVACGGDIPVNAGYGLDMVRIGVAVGARQRLWLLLGVVAMALSLLAMHQLSSNHTAAGHPASPSSTDATLLMSAVHAESHEDAVGGDHAHLTPSTGVGHPVSEVGGCLGCADHSEMGLTCLAALILLMSGWVLTRPGAGPGVWVRRLLHLRLAQRNSWLPQPRSLAQLSVSRT